ncbi:MAG TPA: hypothetical protein VK424_06575 [Thermoplasmata archaeon]|nr:hypothetical protein [Thermoplasmata archaeon]
MVILLLGDPEGHEGLLARHLRARGVPCALFDGENVTLHPATIGLRGGRPEGVLETTSGPVDLASVTCIWSGVSIPRIHVPGMDLAHELLAMEEWSSFLANLFYLTASTPWVNPLDLGRRSGFKLFAASVAAALGLRTPDSLVTSDPARIAPFLSSHKDEVALKVLTHRSFTTRMEGVNWVVWTNRITSEDPRLRDLDFVRVSPVFLQEYVRKRSEVRAYVIGSRVFAAEIFSQEDPATAVDWRRYPTLPTPEGPRGDPDRWRCAPIALPEPLNQKLVALATGLGLRYSAMDLIRREDGEYVFLEANDGGGWGWIEERTKLPLTDAIADLLVEASRSAPSPPPSR